MVSCRYSDSSAIDGGHTICIAVNTNKFDDSGELLKDPQGNPIRLAPEDCAIIDSSGAIVDTIQNNLSHDNGIAEISLQLKQLIDVSNIKMYSLYPKSIQVGPKCSDYARRAYQELSRECYSYSDIENLRIKSFEFANSIHKSVKKDYERVFEGENQTLEGIEKKLNEKAPEKNDYPSRFGPQISKTERTKPLAFLQFNPGRKYYSSPPNKVRKMDENPTSEQGSITDTKPNPVLKSLDFRPRFNQYVRSSNFSPTKSSKMTNKSRLNLS